MHRDKHLLVLVLCAARGLNLVLAAHACDQLTFVDPVTSVEHHCSELCTVSYEAYQAYCEAYCPEYKDCLESQRRARQDVTSTSTTALILEPAGYSVQTQILFGACVTTAGFCVVLTLAVMAARRWCIKSKLQRRNANTNICLVSGLNADCKLKSSMIHSPIFLGSPQQGISSTAGPKVAATQKERGTETKSLLADTYRLQCEVH